MSPMRRAAEEGHGTPQQLFSALQIAASLYVGGMLWLLSVMHVDDGGAARMSAFDWWYGGALRLAYSLAAAIVVAFLSLGLSWMVSRTQAALTLAQSKRLARIAACVAFSGGVVGAVEFVVTKPYF